MKVDPSIALHPFGVRTSCGKYIVRQARDAQHAVDRVKEEEGYQAIDVRAIS